VGPDLLPSPFNPGHTTLRRETRSPPNQSIRPFGPACTQWQTVRPTSLGHLPPPPPTGGRSEGRIFPRPPRAAPCRAALFCPCPPRRAGSSRPNPAPWRYLRHGTRCGRGRTTWCWAPP
jgi:hypothetical protein